MYHLFHELWWFANTLRYPNSYIFPCKCPTSLLTKVLYTWSLWSFWRLFYWEFDLLILCFDCFWSCLKMLFKMSCGTQKATICINLLNMEADMNWQKTKLQSSNSEVFRVVGTLNEICQLGFKCLNLPMGSDLGCDQSHHGRCGGFRRNQ